jgi:hypothetical protein
MWDLWWGSFSPSTSVASANLQSTNFYTITSTYHPGLVQQATSRRSTKSPTAQIKNKILVADFPPRRPGFKPGSSNVGFVVDKVALEQVFSEYLSFTCQSSFHLLLHNHLHYHPRLAE